MNTETSKVKTNKKKLTSKDWTRILCLVLLGAMALSTVAGSVIYLFI